MGRCHRETGTGKVPIQVTCPSCHKPLQAKDELAGKNVKCPACGQILHLPVATAYGPAEEPPVSALEQAAAHEDRVAVEPGQRRAAATPKRGSKAPIFLAIGGLAAVAVVVVVAIARLAGREKQGPTIEGASPEEREVAEVGQATKSEGAAEGSASGSEGTAAARRVPKAATRATVGKTLTLDLGGGVAMKLAQLPQLRG